MAKIKHSSVNRQQHRVTHGVNNMCAKGMRSKANNYNNYNLAD